MKKLLAKYTSLVGGGLVIFSGRVQAISIPTNPFSGSCSDTTSVEGGANCAGTNIGGNLTGTGGIITNGVNTLIVVTGIIAVIMIIVGGIRYITSQGNEKSVEGAKNTVLYAVIGLIIAILAFAIVNFVLKGLGTGDPTGP